MDGLTALLRGPRAQGAFLLRSMLDPPWSLKVRDEAPLTVVAVVRGSAWITIDDGESQQLTTGDVALVRGPRPYTVADDPDTPPQVIIHPGQRCETPDGHRLEEEMGLGVRTWGNSPTGQTVMLTGTYQGDGEVSRRLLAVLPELIVLAAGEWDCPVIALLAGEVAKDEPGQDVVLDRLLDLLVIAVLRTWFARPGVVPPAWYRAHADPVVGRALRLLHNNPAAAWSVASLGAEVGLSRAAFARRFQGLVGQSPMAYLAEWRLALAADLLFEPDTAIARVAREVGYSSPFTFSTAFKRTYGVSPQAFRHQGIRQTA